jgi:hypothetical protein
MRDYFRPFLLKQNNLAGNILAGSNLADTATFDKFKTHVIWALAAGGIGFACWKAGQWHSTYQLVKKKLAE